MTAKVAVYKRCQRPVIKRTEQVKTTSSYLLDLNCGHQVTQGAKNGAVTKTANCPKCFAEGLRTGDAV